ncbi:Uncharacterised protein [Klebsiella pneumoniae]|nr:Uncharacterised protein [Klebsiella pneumoniae]
MASACQHILSGAGIADDQQRRIEHRQLARLVDNLTHFTADGDNMLEFAVIIDRQVLQLLAHTRGGFQQHHAANRTRRSPLFILGMNRGDLHQEVAPLQHHVMRLRFDALALQPALEVEAANQRTGAVVTHLLFIQGEQRLRCRVRQLNFAFQIDGKYRLRQRHQQRTQGAMFTFGRQVRDGTHVGHAGYAANFCHQLAKLVEADAGKIQINAANGGDFDAAQVDAALDQQIQQFAGQTDSVLAKDFKTHAY